MDKIKRIHIVHINDLHSRLDNMARIATYIKELKKESRKKRENVIVADLGDHMDRVRLETEGSKGRVNVEILNNSLVDVATIGNNEGLTFTKEDLEQVYSFRRFRLLACNLRERATGNIPKWLEEYWIQEQGGIRIGWIGATAPYETFYGLQGFDVYEPYHRIKEIVLEIETKVDIIILLSHLGFRSDKRIAELIPAIDVIFGGHTHIFLEAGVKKDNQPLICQVGIFGDYIGHLTIDFNCENRRIEKMLEIVIPASKYKMDLDILTIIENYRALANKELSVQITELKHPLAISIEDESPLGNILADGVRTWVGAEIGLVNSGQILASLGAGLVTKEMLHRICPSPINTCKVRLTGEQIKIVLEQALLNEYKYLQLKGYGFRGRELGTLAISGITVEYDETLPDYEKIKIITYNDSFLLPHKEYIVGTLDMFTFGGGYPLIKEGKDIEYYLPEFIRDILAIQLAKQDLTEECYRARWISSTL